MRKWLQRVRGALGIGVIWAVAWGAVGVVPRWILGFNPDAPFPIIFGVLGFVAGVAFSGVLAFTERRRRLDQLSLPRVAGWGALAGVLLSGVFAKAASLALADVLVIVPTFAAACAACASGLLGVARRAANRELQDIAQVHADAERLGGW